MNRAGGGTSYIPIFYHRSGQSESTVVMYRATATVDVDSRFHPVLLFCECLQALHLLHWKIPFIDHPREGDAFGIHIPRLSREPIAQYTMVLVKGRNLDIKSPD